jgi:excisionase family DNA binding protein
MHEADLTIQSFADFLQIEEKTVYRMAQGGELPGFKVRRQWRFEQVRAVQRRTWGRRGTAG